MGRLPPTAGRSAGEQGHTPVSDVQPRRTCLATQRHDGFGSLTAADCRALAADCRALATDCRALATDCRALTPDCRALTAHHGTFAANGWPLGKTMTKRKKPQISGERLSQAPTSFARGCGGGGGAPSLRRPGGGPRCPNPKTSPSTGPLHTDQTSSTATATVNTRSAHPKASIEHTAARANANARQA
eukprot:COSAG02_NODE_2422_length_8896_cov_10.526657_1_plen_188_part_00